MVDTLASGASGGNPVEVQVLSWAPLFVPNNDTLKTVGTAGQLIKHWREPQLKAVL